MARPTKVLFQITYRDLADLLSVDIGSIYQMAKRGLFDPDNPESVLYFYLGAHYDKKARDTR